jgi:hypothetical protein
VSRAVAEEELPFDNYLPTATFASRPSSAIHTDEREKSARQHAFQASPPIPGAESASRPMQKPLVTSRQPAGEQANRDRVPIRACSAIYSACSGTDCAIPIPEEPAEVNSYFPLITSQLPEFRVVSIKCN